MKAAVEHVQQQYAFSQRQASSARPEHATAEAGSGFEFGQGSTAVGDSKKRMELVAMKAAVEHVQQQYAFSQRRACGL